MKKPLLTLITAVVLAGCSASASAATVQTTQPIVTPVQTVGFWQPKTETLLAAQYEKSVSVLATQSRIANVIRRVENRIGKTWYVFSGDQPTGWDCSGLTRWAYAQLGIEIPHSATKQASSGRLVKTPLLGDIVLFGYKGSKSFYHAALYIGGGKVVHAGFKRGTTTQIIAISSPAFKGSRVAYVRVLDTSPSVP
jgi:cell wall-associated NlpC family hydrolase